MAQPSGGNLCRQDKRMKSMRPDDTFFEEGDAAACGAGRKKMKSPEKAVSLGTWGGRLGTWGGRLGTWGGGLGTSGGGLGTSGCSLGMCSLGM